MYIFSLLTEPLVFAVQKSETTEIEVSPPQLQVVFHQSEVTIGDSILVEVDYEGEYRYISGLNVTVKDRVKGSSETIHCYEGAEGGFRSNYYIDPMKTAGSYEVDSISFMMDDVDYVVYNAKFYDAQQYMQTFDSAFSIIETYGDVRPGYELQISSKEAVPGDLVTVDLYVDTSAYQSQLDSVFLEYNESGQYTEIEMNRIEAGHYQYTREIMQYTRDGSCSLNAIRFHFPEFQLRMTEEYDPVLDKVVDLSAGSFTVSGTVADNEAPMPEEIIMENEIATPFSPSIIRVRGIDESGLSRGEVRIGKDWNEQTITLEKDGEDLVGYYTPYEYEASGAYNMISIYLEDQNGNNVTYVDLASEDPYAEKIDLSTYIFSVHGTYDDLIDFSVTSQMIEESGQKFVRLQLVINENFVNYDSVIMWYQHPEMAEWVQAELMSVSDAVFEGDILITPSMVSGEYNLYFAEFLK